MGEEGPSRHPVDALVRELVRSRRPVAPEGIEDIVERIATAPFGPRDVRLCRVERGLIDDGPLLGNRANSLSVHRARRVLVDRQWGEGTSREQYLSDLRQAARSTRARLAVYARRGGNLAATVSPSEAVVPPPRRGPRFLPLLLVVYSADRGIIVTGYRVSDLQAVAFPEDLQWLR